MMFSVTRLTALFITLLLILPLSGKLFAQEKIIINIAKPSQAYPPYHWTEQGQVIGLVPEIIEAAVKELPHIEVNYVQIPWQRMFEQARKGEIDAIMPISHNFERQQYLDFVSEPLIMERINFVTNTKYNLQFDGDLSKLVNYDIAGIAGYYYGEAVEKHEFNVVELPNEETQIKMLIAGRFPLALLDANVLPFYLKKLGQGEYTLKVLSPHLSEAGLHLAFSKTDINTNKNKQLNYKKLAKQFSHALEKLKSSGTYQAILQKYQLQ